MPAREHWGSRFGFIMATAGFAVGLGNIWRFPYVAYENGGGAFVIPYLVALLTAGIPFLLLDYAGPHLFEGFSRHIELITLPNMIGAGVPTERLYAEPTPPALHRPGRSGPPPMRCGRSSSAP